MNDQLATFIRQVLHALVHVRASARDECHLRRFGAVQGSLHLAESLGLITVEQSFLLADLLLNACRHAGKPFPDRRNLGPTMPIMIKLERQEAALKAPVEVPTDATAQVSAQAAPVGLRLLCLLDKPKLGATSPRYLPVHTMHRVPPRAMVTGKWSEPRYAGLYLRETHAKRPSAELLARILEHGQADTFRADSRAVRAGEMTV